MNNKEFKLFVLSTDVIIKQINKTIKLNENNIVFAVLKEFARYKFL